MEKDLQIIVKGVSEELGTKISGALISILKAFGQIEKPLDFRRMHRVIATADFAGELEELSRETASGNAIVYTNEDYAVAIAKVLLLPRGDSFEILPVLNATMLVPLTEDPESVNFSWMLHVLHHEFCHVHDDNKKLDAMPSVFLRHHYSGKDIFIGPLAETCWSEYAANRLSSSSATETSIAAMTDSFAEALQRTKALVDAEILAYRINAKLDDLMGFFQRHGVFLVHSASYVLGYIDGLEKPLDKLSPKAAAALKDSYFEPNWLAFQHALREMWTIYPDGWKDLSAYAALSKCLEDYYANMGLVLSTAANGGAYVNIPYKPETTPSFGKWPW